MKIKTLFTSLIIISFHLIGNSSISIQEAKEILTQNPMVENPLQDESPTSLLYPYFFEIQGHNHAYNEEYELALEEYTKADKIYKYISQESHRRIALCYLLLGQDKEAVLHLHNAIQKDTDELSGLILASIAKKSSQEIEIWPVAMTQEIRPEIVPGGPEEMYRKGCFHEAGTFLSPYLEENGGNDGFWSLYGTCLTLERRYPDALDAYEKALAIWDGEPEYHLLKGLAHYLKGDLEAFAECLIHPEILDNSYQLEALLLIRYLESPSK